LSERESKQMPPTGLVIQDLMPAGFFGDLEGMSGLRINTNKRRMRNKGYLIIFFLIFFIFSFLSFIFLIWYFWARQPLCNFSVSKKECPEVLFAVKKGEGIRRIAQNLFSHGLIRSPLAFKIQVVVKNLNGKIQAGDYYLSPADDCSVIAGCLTRGTFDKKVTIIEGWRAEEIGEYLLKQGINIDLAAWRKKIQQEELEGHLFPDTYMISSQANMEKIVSTFLKNFDKKFSLELETEALKKGIDKQSVLILASLVEREVRHEEDRSVVAGIFLKRLKENWPLQVDATVQYAKGNVKCKNQNMGCDWWPGKLTEVDLEIKSPYNTYLYRGLPPGPICDPGLSAIKAVIYAQDSPYWYYLSDPSGVMHYAKTDSEHLANIKKYLSN